MSRVNAAHSVGAWAAILTKALCRESGRFRYAKVGTVSTLERDPTEGMVRVLDEDGGVVGDVPDLDDDELVEMYRQMRLARHFDERAVSLNRQGRMGTYPPMSGQEGAQVGSAMAMGDDDWMIPSYREHAAALVRGQGLTETLRYWMGDERGDSPEEGTNVFSVAVPIASQIPHATGMAWAEKLQSDSDHGAFVCYFGDGATSEGDFHEGLNFAGVFDTPNVFFCNNNQWAISVPRERQTASETLAQKHERTGSRGSRSTGWTHWRCTVSPARHSRSTRPRGRTVAPDDDRGGPVPVRCTHHCRRPVGVPHRRGGGTVARERPDPRLESYLRSQGVLDDARVEAIGASVEDAVADAIDEAEATADPDPQSMFEHVYAEQTPELRDQAEQFADLRERHGDDAFQIE
ncbi:MAG: pyruvate/2-oxoglutarate dehydrogenase complex, dehydrogenase (E1) component, alpha subunit [halophilic archaeon J07HB67]|nr:MAG: pyruvate/2-oxoglutarate dehydrogenase complex, dehydrogenase (E1) component, alpha subunit [halophilic archaeon J07HB67]